MAKVDKSLVPPEAPRAGRFGLDTEIYMLCEGLMERSRSLTARFRATPGIDRRGRLSRIFDAIVDEEGEERSWLWELAEIDEIDWPDEIEDGVLYAKKKELLAQLDELVPKRGQQVKAPIYRIVAQISGSSVQTIKNAIKRERARIRREVKGK